MTEDPPSTSVLHRLDLASTVGIDLPAQLVLAADEYEMVQERLAANPSLADAAQDALMRSPYPRVIKALASNPTLLAHHQLTLAEAGDPELRYAVALNATSFPPRLRRILATDPNWEVRMILSENPALELTDDLPVGFLHESMRLRGHLAARLAGFDIASAAALVHHWEGTLGELVAVLTSFEPERQPFSHPHDGAAP